MRKSGEYAICIIGLGGWMPLITGSNEPPQNIVIVISRLLTRYLKAKRSRAPAYSEALRRIKEGFSRGWSKEAQVRFPGGQKGDRVAVKVDVVQMGRVNDQRNKFITVKKTLQTYIKT